MTTNTTNITKAETEASFAEFYNLRKQKLVTISILISAVIIFIADNNIDLNLYVYMPLQVLLPIIVFRTYKKYLIRAYARNLEIIHTEDFTLTGNQLRINSKDGEMELESGNYDLISTMDFLLIITKIRTKEFFRTKILHIKGDQSEIQRIHTALNPNKRKRNPKKLAILTGLFLISTLAWKTDNCILNKYTYNTDAQWEIASIRQGKRTPLDKKYFEVNYMGMANNFTLDTSVFFSDQVLLHYRHERFGGVRILYSAGTPNKRIESLIKDKDFLSGYNFRYAPDSLILSNRKFRITCVKRKRANHTNLK